MDKFECYTCNKVKPLSEFGKDRGRKRGHLTRCKECVDLKRFEGREAVGEIPKSKRCSSCYKTKESECFNKSLRSKSGLRSSCRQCDKKVRPERTEEIRKIEKDRSLRSSFGITLENYEDMLEEQGGVCFVCKRVNSHGWNLAVDHCHETKVIRALLCHGCNSSLGHLSEDVSILESIIEYAKLCIETRDSGETGLFYRDSNGRIPNQFSFIDTARVTAVRHKSS